MNRTLLIFATGTFILMMACQREPERRFDLKGKVVSVDGSGPNKKATVFFQGVGQKQLLLRFAKLTIVE